MMAQGQLRADILFPFNVSGKTLAAGEWKVSMVFTGGAPLGPL